MRIAEIMTLYPVSCDVDDSAFDVAQLLRDKNIGCVIVLREGKVAGIITDRQLTVGVMAEGLDAQQVSAEDVMTPDPATVRAGETVFDLIDTLRGAGVVRRVPVVNHDKQLVGVVSISDVAVVAKDLLDAILLEDTRHALREVRLPTGGKRIRKAIMNPRRAAVG